MGRRASVPHVHFAKDVEWFRGPWDEERSVMKRIAGHATRCDFCRDPHDAWRWGRPLCKRGLSFARDVATHLYANGGKSFSVVDRKHGDRVLVQIPAGFEAVSRLVMAFGRGMAMNSNGVVVDYSRKYETLETALKVGPPPLPPEWRNERPRHGQWIDGPRDVVEIKPCASRDGKTARNINRCDDQKPRERWKRSVDEGRGTLSPRQGGKRSHPYRHESRPFVIVVEPGQWCIPRRCR